MTAVGYRLGIDFGTSNTVAVVRERDGGTRPVLFDGFPLLPSAVCVALEGSGLLVGREAIHAARVRPERFEPHPKRRIDEGTVLLGDTEYPVEHLIAAVLARVKAEAVRANGGEPAEVVLTFPAAWGQRRRGTLLAGAQLAGLGSPELVAEPVAAASYFAAATGTRVPPGGCVAVYDFGAGTFDASVVARTAEGWEVLASDGLLDAGGLDVDAAIVEHLDTVFSAGHPEQMRRLGEPQTGADRRARHNLWEDVRTAKEILSRSSSTYIHVPLVEQDAPLGREQLERLARPVVDRTVAMTRSVLSGVVADRPLAGLFLVGGSSRMPLVATLLHQATGAAPTVMEQPELAVAEGGARPLATTGSQPVAPTSPAVPPPRPPVRGVAAVRAPRAGPARVAMPATGAPMPVSGMPMPMPVSGAPLPPLPVSGPPLTGSPVSGPPSGAQPAPPTGATPEPGPGPDRPAAVRAALAAAGLFVLLSAFNIVGTAADNNEWGLPPDLSAWRRFITDVNVYLFPGFVLWLAYLFAAPGGRLRPRLLTHGLLAVPVLFVVGQVATVVAVLTGTTGLLVVFVAALLAAVALLGARRRLDGTELSPVFGRADAGGMLLGALIVQAGRAPLYTYLVAAIEDGETTGLAALKVLDIQWETWMFGLSVALALIGLGAATGRFTAAISPTAGRWLPRMAAVAMLVGALVAVSKVVDQLYGSGSP